ncbi:myosin-11-like isoform X2 [Daphnia pulex]|uniref:myosin-11-like isoform X2 n=1 Tax=Daphnia pulex TaxID=6669 RepID=UPI001EDDAD8A|nr:myosin-11-like isoform X2 [Daphnia pulex]
MSQRGASQSFLFKYAPLRLKGVNNQQQLSNNSKVYPSGTPYSPRALQSQSNNPSIDESAMTGNETNYSEQGDLNSSLENIAKVCQRQERRNREMQLQLESATSEMERLKGLLDAAAGEIDQLHNINEKLKDSHQKLEKELKEVDHLYTDVKTTAADTAQILEDARKDKETWLSNFERLLTNHFDKREMQLRNEFQQIIDEKEVKLNAMRCEAEHLEIQFHGTAEIRAEIASSREQIKQLNSVNDAKETELNTLRDKLMTIQEAVATYEDTKHSLNILTKERAALQERYSAIEKQCISTGDALVDCMNDRNRLENSVDELNKKLEDESKKTIHSISETQELIQQLTTCQQMLEEKTTKIEDLCNQLSILNEHNRDLERKTREAESIFADQETSQRLIADLEKQIAELKFQLSEKAIELQCKEKKIEETENALKDLSLHSHSDEQLAIIEENNRELQRKFDEKAQELEAALVCQENSQRLKADLDKEVADLKCQLISKSIELQYKGERMEEMEKALDELTQKSLNAERAETCRSEVDMPRQKEKLEIDALKTSLNLKNLELESIGGEYEEAQKIMASSERKIADLELTVSLLERRLETEREQASFSSQQPVIKAAVEPARSLRPILKQTFSDVKQQELASQDKGDSAKTAMDTLNLLQKANAMAKAAEVKRRDSGGSQISMMIKPSSPSSSSKPSEKRRRFDTPDGLRASAIKMDLRDCVDIDSPVLRNNSGLRTPRFLPRSNSTAYLTSAELPPEDLEFDTNESF